MAEFTYLTNPAKIREFLLKIKTVGVPEKVTNNYLVSVGFKSSNDRALITVLKSLKFVDSSGKPTTRWQHYRGYKCRKGFN
jgi:hypothetical protein